MMKISQIILDPGEVVLCDYCHPALINECVELPFQAGYFHKACGLTLHAAYDKILGDKIALYDSA